MATPTERLVRRLLLLRGFASEEVPTSTSRVHYLTAPCGGTLPPLLAVHGFAASAIQLAPLIHFLRPEVRRISLVDLPGHGFSEVPSGVFDTDALLQGVIEALDRIIQEPVVLLGNSMGGYIAVRYALHAPHKVAKLVLVSPGGAEMDQATLDEMRRPFHVSSHRDALHFVDRLLGRPSPMRHLYALSVRRRLGRADLLAVLDAVRTDQLLAGDDVARLAMPTLCVWGQGDDVLPRANLDFFRRHLPAHAQVLEPPHYGHAPYIEAPRGLARMVLDFVRAAAPAIDAAPQSVAPPVTA